MQDYTIHLQVFEGPLDLLLHLIEKRELDITAISLATVADQYLEYLNTVDQDLDALADFLVIASKLLVLKSVAMFPQPATSSEPEDIAVDLTQRLIEYRAFKRVAEYLRALEEREQRSYPRLAAAQPIRGSSLPDGLTVSDLVAAFRRALSRTPAQPTPVALPRPVFSVVEKAKVILAETRRGRTVSFHQLLSQASCREEVVAMLLAVLELLRTRRIDVTQEQLFGDISLVARPPADGEERHEDTEGIDEHVGELGVAIRREALVELVETGVGDRKDQRP